MARRKMTPSEDGSTPLSSVEQEKEPAAAEAAPKKKGRPRKKKEPEIVMEVLPEDVVEVSSVAAPLTVSEASSASEPSLASEPTPEAQKEPQERKDHEKNDNGGDGKEPIGKNLPVWRKNGALVQTEMSPITAPAATERKNFWKTILAIVILTAVVAAAIWIFTFRTPPFGEKHDAVNFFYMAEKDATVVAYNGTYRSEIGGALSYSTHSSDGKIHAAIIGGNLYLVRGNNVEKIADGVQDCVLSTGGEALAWRVGDTLFYDLLNDKAAASSISVTANDSRYTLSPDGNELFYVYSKDGVPHARFESRNGSAPFIAKNKELFPVAIANRCQQIYYTDATGALYVLNAGTEAPVLCGTNVDITKLIFNRTNTQLILQDNGQTRIFENGKEVRIPSLESGTLQYLQNKRVAARDVPVGVQYMTDTLFHTYYLHKTGDSELLVYLKKENDQAIIERLSNPHADSADVISVTDAAVYYLATSTEGDGTTNTRLYRCPNGSTASEPLTWGVSNFCTNKDGSRLLYTNDQGALYSLKIGTAATRLMDHVDIASLSVNSEDVFYFYKDAGSLWLSDNGGAPRLVSDGVADFMTDGQTLYYLANADENGVGTVYALYQSHKRSNQIAERVAKIN